jgi:hypothetical protein
MARRFWATRPAILAGQLNQLSLLDRLDDDTTVRRRPTSVCHTTVVGGRVELVLADRTVGLPSALEPALRRLIGADPVKVAALAGWLDAQSRLVLVRRLVREGLLELLPPD